MDDTKQKIFRDPVHGYISVPSSLCRAFIDTPIFQRLKNIEQTSMRPLYPSAHHDRFVHSLGVYYLASLAFHHIKKNTNPEYIKSVDLDHYKPLFLVAALMHDCGHAPFSHTFEEFYNRNRRAEEFLFSQVDTKFKKDYDHNYDTRGKGPSDHEVFSAAIFLKHYATAFRQLFPDQDPIVIARMITGCIHQPAKTLKEEVENCLILLINGQAIDVDKLDYIQRDTWASGANNVSIDIHRLLSVLELSTYDNRLVPAFSKSALNVVQSVLDGRNFLYNWIYSHHTVCYYSRLLSEAIRQLSHLLSPPEKPDRLLDVLFSAESFERPVPVGNSLLYLPSDGDIFYLLKQRHNDIKEIGELLSRQPRLVPLWKTFAEFELIFEKKKDLTQRESVRTRVKDILSKVIKEESHLQSIITLQVKPKLAVIHENELYVSLRDSVVPFKSIATPPAIKENVSYFLVFIPRETADLAESCISALSGSKTY